MKIPGVMPWWSVIIQYKRRFRIINTIPQCIFLMVPLQSTLVNCFTDQTS